MPSVLDIELLRTFHAVARAGRFKAAAEQLHKSPAAISVHIQRLESVAGGRLLDRDNQSVALTVLGQRLLIATTELLNTHDRVLSEVQGTQLSGRVTLGIPDEYSAHVIRDILPIFAAAWPNVVLEVKTAPSYSLRDLVERGKLQLAVMVQSRAARVPNAQVLLSTLPVWVGGLNSPAQWPDPLPLALYADDCPYRRVMLEALKQQGRQWRVVVDSPSSQAVSACVEAGLGITLIDHARVTRRMQILHGLPVIAEHEVVLLRARSSQTEQAIDLLAAAIAQHFRL